MTKTTTRPNWLSTCSGLNVVLLLQASSASAAESTSGAINLADRLATPRQSRTGSLPTPRVTAAIERLATPRHAPGTIKRAASAGGSTAGAISNGKIGSYASVPRRSPSSTSQSSTRWT